MIIDSHGHVTAPAELYAYKAGLVSHRGAHGRGTPGISDELLERALQAPRVRRKSHLEQLKEAGTDLQLDLPPALPADAQRETGPHRPLVDRGEQHRDRPPVQGAPRRIPRRVRPTAVRGCGREPRRRGAGALREGAGVRRLPAEPRPDGGPGPDTAGSGDEYWYPLYEKLVELDVPAPIHSAGCRSPRESYSLHFVNEESTAVIGLCSSRVFQDFPRLKIMVSHGGGAIPYQIGRFRAARWRQKGAEEFDAALRRLYFDTCLYSREALEPLFKVVGTDRCLFGTERPGPARPRIQAPVSGRTT